MTDHSSSDDDELSQALMLENDPYLSSSPSIQEDEIDFQYVYALRTFTATEQGQANAVKGDAMILLNDTNSYWWLVRLVKDSTVGFLPAEHIETPSERLARLNKHRNSEFCSPATFSYSTKLRKPGSKSVKFTPTLTYVSASEYEYSDGDEADVEDIGDYDSDDDEDDHVDSASNHNSIHSNNLIHNGVSNGNNVHLSTTATTTPISAVGTAPSYNDPTTTDSKPEPLALRKPSSNLSLHSNPPGFNTNSDEDSSESGEANNHALLVSKRSMSDLSDNNNTDNMHTSNNLNNPNHHRSNSSNAVSNTSSSLFSRLSRGVNRRHSAIPSPVAESGEKFPNNNSHNKNVHAINGSVAAGVAAFSNNQNEDNFNNQARRRSLIKVKSSTEHLKKNSVGTPDSSIHTINEHGTNSFTNNTSHGNNNNSSLSGFFKRSRKGSVTTQIPHAVRRDNQSSPSPTSSMSSMSMASSLATSPEVHEHGVKQQYSDYSMTAPLNVRSSAIISENGHNNSHNVSNSLINNNGYYNNPNSISHILSSAPSDKPSSTSSMTSTSSLPSDMSDKDTRSGSAATMSTIPSSPSFDESGDDAPSGKDPLYQKEVSTPQKSFTKNMGSSFEYTDINANNNTVNNSVEESENFNNRLIKQSTAGSISPPPVTLPLQVSPSKPSVNTPGSSAKSFKNVEGDASVIISPMQTATAASGVVDTDNKNNSSLTADGHESNPTRNVSHFPQVVNNYSKDVCTTASGTNTAWTTTSMPKLHPDIIPIYQDTVVRLERMSSRIDAILQKYCPAAPVVPTC